MWHMPQAPVACTESLSSAWSTSMKIASRERPRVGRKLLILLAVAMFAQASVWSFYASQVPACLQVYLTSAGRIGLVMGIDNVLGVILQPLMGHRSDRLKRRVGSRVPV